MILMPRKLFGTSGIRGNAEELFTDEFCIQIGFTFGMWLKSKGKQGYVAMAMDPRESSPRIKSRVANGLAAAGWEILDEGVVPVPALTYFVKQTPAVGGGVMVTGSHITANLNGVKLLVNGEEVTKTDEKEIEQLFATTKFPSMKVEPIVKFDQSAQELYIELLKNLAAFNPKWKIVIDTTNGAQTEIVRQLFSQLGMKYQTVNDFDIQSPHFVPCDTEFPSMFTDLIRKVLLTKADFGLAFDVDGDRVVFVDSLGRFIPGDYACSLLAREPEVKSIVTPISTSSVVDHLGKKVYRTQVGSTWVSAKMKEVGSNFGFEANGGSLNPEVSYGRDGGVTAVKIMNLIKKSNQTLTELYDSLPKLYLTRQKVDCPFAKYDQVLAAVRQKFASKKIEDLDGLKVHMTPDEWVLFRGSGNSPEFKIFAESPNEKRSLRLGNEGLDLVRSVITKSHQSTGAGGDSLGVLAAIGMLPKQVHQVLTEMPLQHVPVNCNLVNNIVVSGMGGSALGGRILANLERQVLRVPLIVSTEYHLPNFVNEKTLVVASSYSGNTEETLTSLHEAIARNAQIFVIASGGKLAQIALEKKIPSYIFDAKFNQSGQPRLGLGYNVMALLGLLARCQLINPPASLSELTEFLEYNQKWSQQEAEKIAYQIAGKIPLILVSEHLKGVAHDFKNQLNENAKNMATYFDLPEADHHLLEGLNFPKTNPDTLQAVFFTSDKYHPEVRKRYPLTETVFHKQHIPSLKIEAKGPNTFFEAMYMIQLASYISFYVSQLNGIDPGPIPWVDFFKSEIDL